MRLDRELDAMIESMKAEDELIRARIQRRMEEALEKATLSFEGLTDGDPMPEVRKSKKAKEEIGRGQRDSKRDGRGGVMADVDFVKELSESARRSKNRITSDIYSDTRTSKEGYILGIDASPLKGELELVDMEEVMPGVSTPVDSKAIMGVEAMIGVAGARRGWRHRHIYYGHNKTGKTSLVADPKTLIINCEDGDSVFLKFPADKRPVEMPCHDKSSLEALYWFLKKQPLHKSGRGLVIPTSVGPWHIDTIAIDTVTRLIYWALRETALKGKAKDPTAELTSISLPQRGDAYSFVTHWLIQFRDLPVHTVWLCQEREPTEKDKLPDSIEVCPDMPPSVRNVIQGDADIIARTYVKGEGKEAEFVLQFGPSSSYVAGDRFGIMPPEHKHVRIRAILNHIEKKLKGD